jgi:ABC-2 type transport system permease protein
MREAAALIRASWLAASSYRVGMVMSIGGLVATIVPLYFVAGALQPFMAPRLGGEGSHYFGFVIVGVLAFSFLSTAVNALPGAVGASIGSGTLEAMLATPARLPSLLIGLVGYAFTWTAVRAAVTLVLAVLLGARLGVGNNGLALGILALIVVAYFSIGLLAAAMVLAFRTSGPLPQVVLILSGLLGGVYYPTSVIPSWVQSLSSALPLTYGLRALRHVWLEGATASAVAPDVTMLVGFAAFLFGTCSIAFILALEHARRAGTLGHY